MQDIHSIGGGATGGSRRLRVPGNHALTISNLNSHYPHHHHQGALKCPRCDSLNTKFCYYNNYNLSQPRHFCKSCRRYWTNGGVLRNVPVGGGCRKSKRASSNSKSKRHHRSPSPAANTPSTTAPPPPPQAASNSYSSSESSSLTAVEAVSSGLSSLAGVPLQQGIINRPTTVFDQQTGPLFPELGGPSTFMPSSSEAVDAGLNFGFHGVLMNQNRHQQQPQPQPQPQQAQPGLWGQQKLGVSFLDDEQKDSVIGSFDWQGSCGGVGPVDQSFFDLSLINTVDNSFWNQTNWGSTTVAGGDHLDHQNLFLP